MIRFVNFLLFFINNLFDTKTKLYKNLKEITHIDEKEIRDTGFKIISFPTKKNEHFFDVMSAL